MTLIATALIIIAGSMVVMAVDVSLHRMAQEKIDLRLHDIYDATR